MELWWTEDWSDNILFSIKAKKLLYSKKSAFQQIDILDSSEYGRFLTLDGLMMVNARDEFIYHEMMVHPAICVNPMIKKVLVIGGGDGGTIRELTRYPSIERIDLVEIDEQVVRACQQFLPLTASKLSDSRVKLFFEDGIQWVRHAKSAEYDLIIVDSTDPIGPGAGLFTTTFYQNCFRALSEQGILINQQMSPYFKWDVQKAQEAHIRIKQIFPQAFIYHAHTPTYASGLSLFGLATKALDPIKDAKFATWNRLGLVTKYYNTKLHQGAFWQPTYIKELFDLPNMQLSGPKFIKLFKESIKNQAVNQLDFWFTEKWTEHTHFQIRVTEHLYCEKSTFQQIDIFESMEFGRFLTLDGLLMCTEKDEFIYHEMMVHPAMCVNPMIKKVLVIGGGDGGTVRELTRYPHILHIDLVEIDEQVVRACQQFLPLTAAKLSDERVHLVFADGVAWVKNAGDHEYDLIIVDSTDPIGPGEGLFTMDFYQNCFRILAKDGILVNQHESAYFEQDAATMKGIHAKIKRVFPISEVYQAHIPTYASGHWLFGFAAKTLDPIKNVDVTAWDQLKLKTKYYNSDLHMGAFMLPTYVKELLSRS